MTQNHDAFSDLAPLPECFVDDARHHPVNVAREPLYPVFYYCDCGRTWRLTQVVSRASLGTTGDHDSAVVEWEEV